MSHNKNILPLREPTYFVLLALKNGSRHGYGLIQRVAELANTDKKMSNGTLYGLLTRMLEQGLIDQVADAGEQKAGKPRKAYQLTDFGGEILQAEVQRLQALAAIGQQILSR